MTQKILYYDCFAGISGDMNLGALIDLGVSSDFLRAELAKLNIAGFRLDITSDQRKGIAGTKATVIVDNPDNEKHRHLRHVEEIVNNSALSDIVKTLSLKIFNLIAYAEAKVHNIAVERIHFHEVGALDSIADIVGAAICLDALKVDKVLASPIELGGGMVKCAHGIFPVPAPATALIVQDVPVKMGLVQHEATTPTGAAILVALVDQFVTTCDFKILKTGYGIGHRDTDVPNVLRVYLAETTNVTVSDVSIEQATMLECNIDDMNPEWFDHVKEKLFEAGASEVFYMPVMMKKSRPANVLSVLSKNELVDEMKNIIFTHTSTIGLRQYTVQKNMLRRAEISISTIYGDVNVKQSFFNGKMVHAKPEYDDLKLLAIKHNISIETINNEVLKVL